MCESVLHGRYSPDCTAISEMVDALSASPMPTLHAHMLQQALLTRALDTVCFSSGIVAGNSITVRAALAVCSLAVDHVVFRRTSLITGSGVPQNATNVSFSSPSRNKMETTASITESTRLGFGFLCTVFQIMRSLLVYPAMVATPVLPSLLGRLVLYLLRPSLPPSHGDFVANALSTHARVISALSFDNKLLANIFVALVQYRDRSLSVRYWVFFVDCELIPVS